MPSTDVEICNQALMHIGSTVQISALSDNNKQARQCQRIYDQAVDYVLDQLWWPFATKVATLGLVQTEPNKFWSYEYRYPSDAIHLRYITHESVWQGLLVPYQLSDDATARLIWTDQQDACAVYTERVTTTTRWSATFCDALSYRIASLVAMPIVGDKGLVADMNNKFEIYINQAKALAMNEIQPSPEPETPSILARQ